MTGAMSTFESITNPPSERLIAAEKVLEGFSAKPYRDPGGVVTWGYGFTEGEPPTEPMTEEEAGRYLVELLTKTQAEMQTIFRMPLTPGQQDALTDMLYNVGQGRADEKDGLVWLKKRDANNCPQHSTIFKLIHNKDYMAAANELPKWDLINGEVSEALMKRCELRRMWFTEFLTGKIYSFDYAWGEINKRVAHAKEVIAINKAARQGLNKSS